MGVRRLLLSRTGYYLYYQVNAEAGRIEVVAFWHSRRGREPFILVRALHNMALQADQQQFN